MSAKSIFDGAGYFFNDDRASGGKLAEDDLLGCAHCETPMKRAAWRQQGGMCMVCSKPMCSRCTHRMVQLKLGCEGPVEKRIAAAVNDQYRRSQNAKILGI